jgi:hypothetical protein
MSDELIEELARLLAEALIADIRQYPNLSELQPNPEPTVESSSGLDRTDPPARRGRARQEHAAPDRPACAGPSDRRPLPGFLEDGTPKKSAPSREAPGARLLPAKKFET